MPAKLTPLELEVRGLLAIGRRDGTPLGVLARQVVARVQGPSPLTPKQRALPEDARRLAHRYDHLAPPPGA